MVFGLSFGEFVRRSFLAIVWAAVTFSLAFYLPTLFSSLANLPTEEAQAVILPGALLLSGLGVLREVFRDHPIGTAAAVGLGIASTVYLLRITNFGYMRVDAAGFRVILEFPSLVYLLATSSMLFVISTIWAAIHSVGAEPMEKLEEEIKP